MIAPPPKWQLTTAETVGRARIILDEHRAGLTRDGIPGDLTLTGGSSIEGLLTKGDIDLHLRVDSDDFSLATAQLADRYDAARREIWTPSFAVFERSDHPPVGIAVTVIGSEHDRRFVVTWERMRVDSTARQTYNALKLGGGDIEERKSRFFDSLIAGRI